MGFSFRVSNEDPNKRKGEKTAERFLEESQFYASFK